MLFSCYFIFYTFIQVQFLALAQAASVTPGPGSPKAPGGVDAPIWASVPHEQSRDSSAPFTQGFACLACLDQRLAGYSSRAGYGLQSRRGSFVPGGGDEALCRGRAGRGNSDNWPVRGTPAHLSRGSRALLTAALVHQFFWEETTPCRVFKQHLAPRAPADPVSEAAPVVLLSK